MGKGLMRFKAITDSNRKPQVNWDRIYAYCARWKPGTALDLEITRRQPKVSSPMRAYYFSTVLPKFLEAYYYEQDEALEVHKFIKCAFFHVKPDKHGIIRKKDIPSVFSDDPTVKPEDRKRFLEWVIRKCTDPKSDNPQYVPEPGERGG